LDDRTRITLGRSLAAVAAFLAVVALLLYIASGEATRLIDDWAIHNIWVAIFGAGVVMLAIHKVPRNGAVWAIAWSALFSSLQAFGAGLGVAVAGVSNGDVQAGNVSVAPADIEFLAALGLDIALWAWVPALFIFVTFGVLLFPNGDLPSPRWRWVGWLAVGAMVFVTLPWAWMFRPSSTVSYEETYAQLDATLAGGVGFLGLLAATAASVVGLVVKWRKADAEERLQFRWVGWGLLVFAVTTVVVLGVDTDAYRIVSLFVIPLISITYGVAITKYRLYDIDIVISRTIVYGALALFIGAVYVVVVVITGSTVTGGGQPNAAVTIAATALIAVAFQPLRRWLERWANRVVYGKQATPYEVLSEFSQRVAATDDGLVDEVVESLVGGTGADTAAIWVADRGRWVRTAVFPLDTPPTVAPRLGDQTADDSVVVPVEHDGETLGLVALHAPGGQRLAESDHTLAAQVASGMGLALHNQRLTDMLRRRVDELRDSRRRIVAVQDETRRTLERNLHDGAQQQLVALKVKLGLAKRMAAKDQAPRTEAMLGELSVESDEAVDAMRTFARGIYPPLLEAEGLEAALQAQARRAPFPVDLNVDGLGRYGRDTEATVYFCVSEALQNAAKYASASAVEVSLAQSNEVVRFEILDDGVGFDPAKAGAQGSGLTNMTDRVDALGGELAIESAPGRTRLIGGLPATPLEVRTTSAAPSRGSEQ
jgi:signal transduction histidine kinase